MTVVMMENMSESILGEERGNYGEKGESRNEVHSEENDRDGDKCGGEVFVHGSIMGDGR